MPNWGHIIGYATDRHPKDRTQWQVQQALTNLPVIGNIYRNYMVSQSTNERNDYLRNLYGYGTSGNPIGMYPWLSGLNNNNPTAQALGGMAQATGIGAIMRIYGNGKRDNKPDQRYQRHLDDWY